MVMSMPISIMYDMEIYRDLRICRCNYQYRVNINKNFEENYDKYVGVLFDSMSLITSLVEDESIQNSSEFLNMDLKEKENIYLVNFKNNIQYVGEVINDKLEGLGKIIINDSLYYIGEFKNNLFDGKGILKSNFGDNYNGEFKKGCVSGEGKVMWLNGNYYEGNFEDNLFEGTGKICYYNGDCFNGIFNKGKKHGFGNFIGYCAGSKLEVKDMNWYKGNLLHFVGEIKISNINMSEGKRKEIVYKGMIKSTYFLNLRRISIYPHGIGTLHYDKDLYYVGEFLQGQKHGEGTQNFSDGIYKGEFQRNRKHGAGKIYNKDEKLIFEGIFYSGRKHGPCWVYNNDKTEFITYKLGKKFGKSSYVDSNFKPVINYYNGDTIVSKKVKDLEEEATLLEDSCSICFDKFKKSDHVSKLYKCGHVFHSQCLFSWLKTKDSCPLCREKEIFKPMKF